VRKWVEEWEGYILMKGYIKIEQLPVEFSKE
jgi:hypothetical protein